MIEEGVPASFPVSLPPPSCYLKNLKNKKRTGKLSNGTKQEQTFALIIQIKPKLIQLIAKAAINEININELRVQSEARHGVLMCEHLIIR